MAMHVVEQLLKGGGWTIMCASYEEDYIIGMYKLSVAKGGDRYFRRSTIHEENVPHDYGPEFPGARTKETS